MTAIVLRKKQATMFSVAVAVLDMQAHGPLTPTAFASSRAKFEHRCDGCGYWVAVGQKILLVERDGYDANGSMWAHEQCITLQQLNWPSVLAEFTSWVIQTESPFVIQKKFSDGYRAQCEGCRIYSTNWVDLRRYVDGEWPPIVTRRCTDRCIKVT